VLFSVFISGGVVRINDLFCKGEAGPRSV